MTRVLGICPQARYVCSAQVLVIGCEERAVLVQVGLVNEFHKLGRRRKEVATADLNEFGRRLRTLNNDCCPVHQRHCGPAENRNQHHLLQIACF